MGVQDLFNKIKYTMRLIAKLYGIPYTQIERTVLGKPFGSVDKSGESGKKFTLGKKKSGRTNRLKF